MKEMNRYQVVYTIATIIHAEDEKDAWTLPQSWI